jgi:hypothetical protein
MSNLVVLKCPGDFFALGKQDVLLGNQVGCHWQYWRTGDFTSRAINDCLAHLCRRFYTDQLRERVARAMSQAVPFVANRTHPEEPVKVGLVRFVSRGQKCVTLTIDSMPLPGRKIDVPEPTNPAVTQPTIGPYLSFGLIYRVVDGFLFINDEHILQLSLSWSE